MTNDTDTNSLKSSMVRLADTVRLIHVIGTRIRNGISSDELADPVFRDYDIVGSTDRIDSNRDNPIGSKDDHIIKGLYNVKIKPRKRASYEPYL